MTCETKSKSSPGPTTLSQACQASGTWGSSHWPLTGLSQAMTVRTTHKRTSCGHSRVYGPVSTSGSCGPPAACLLSPACFQPASSLLPLPPASSSLPPACFQSASSLPPASSLPVGPLNLPVEPFNLAEAWHKIAASLRMCAHGALTCIVSSATSLHAIFLRNRSIFTRSFSTSCRAAQQGCRNCPARIFPRPLKRANTMETMETKRNSCLFWTPSVK